MKLFRACDCWTVECPHNPPETKVDWKKWNRMQRKEKITSFYRRVLCVFGAHNFDLVGEHGLYYCRSCGWVKVKDL